MHNHRRYRARQHSLMDTDTSLPPDMLSLHVRARLRKTHPIFTTVSTHHLIGSYTYPKDSTAYRHTRYMSRRGTVCDRLPGIRTLLDYYSTKFTVDAAMATMTMADPRAGSFLKPRCCWHGVCHYLNRQPDGRHTMDVASKRKLRILLCCVIRSKAPQKRGQCENI